MTWLHAAIELGGHHWQAWSSGTGGSRAAEFIESASKSQPGTGSNRCAALS
jgi:hypothetical protein